MILAGSVFKPIRMFKLMGSFLLIVLSVVILTDGISTVKNLTTEVLASVAFGIGMISLITDAFTGKEHMREEEETEDFEDLEDGRFHD